MKQNSSLTEKKLKIAIGVILFTMSSQQALALAPTNIQDVANININANTDNSGNEGVFITANTTTTDGTVAGSSASIAVTSNSGTNGQVNLTSSNGNVTLNSDVSTIVSGGNLAVNTSETILSGLNVTGGTITDSLQVNGNNTVTGSTTLTGLLTANSGLTSIGTTLINTTGTAATTIGNSSAATTVSATGGNSGLSIVDGQASLQSGTGTTGYSTHSTLQTVAAATAAPAANHYNLVNANAASQALVAGASVQNIIKGNTLVDGNMYINGTLNYSSDNSATTTVSSGTSVLTNATQTTVGQSSITNQGAPGYTVDSNGKILASSAVTQSTASLTLTNGLGNTHGIVVQENQTTISGGTASSSMALNNNGATFSNAQNGSAIQLHGVANGYAPTDAVNVSQLNAVSTRAYSGIAQIAAMQAVPAPIAGKNYSIGIGSGFYAGQQAIAFGAKANVSENINVSASVANGFGSNSDLAASVGAGLSF